jgi:hypothetical protein
MDGVKYERMKERVKEEEAKPKERRYGQSMLEGAA